MEQSFEKVLAKLPKNPENWTVDNVLAFVADHNSQSLNRFIEREKINGKELLSFDYKNYDEKIKFTDFKKLESNRKLLLKKLELDKSEEQKDNKNNYKYEFRNINKMDYSLLSKNFSNTKQKLENKNFEEKSNNSKLVVINNQNKNFEEKSSISKVVVINNLNKEKLILTLLKKKSIQFELEKKNGLIGREPKESDLFIQLKNDKVSRIHAEIVYNEYGYYIRDKKSANGTFISLPYKKDWILKEGMKFEAGSNEYQISKILNDTIEFNCTEGELLNEKYYLSVPTNKSDFTSIGKSVSNYLKINDEDLEDEHIKIYKNEKNNVIMTPMNEKSEIFIRLSENDHYPLNEGTIFSVSQQFFFKVTKTFVKELQEQKNNDKLCCVCKKNPKNCMVNTCKHRFACYDCVQSQKIFSCRVCNDYIQDYFIIYI